MRTTQRKGDIATSRAIAAFTAIGYDVSIPLTESAAYDLVVDDGRELRGFNASSPTIPTVKWI
jgi:PD-(D/E)XK endonuclease